MDSQWLTQEQKNVCDYEKLRQDDQAFAQSTKPYALTNSFYSCEFPARRWEFVFILVNPRVILLTHYYAKEDCIKDETEDHVHGSWYLNQHTPAPDKPSTYALVLLSFRMDGWLKSKFNTT